ncbi:MAG: DHH family phosphoesterase [DPANN group archaeon]|nr:DHH family phosphoesterase [DPANN group archaeon]
MIENIIGSKSKIAVLKALFIYGKEKGTTIRKLAITSDTPYSVAYRDIEHFLEEDFIKIKKNGTNKIISFNINHKLYPKIQTLLESEVDDETENKPKKMFKHKKGLIIVHHNADPDAIGSAIALARGFNQSNLKCEIFAPGGLSSQSKRLLEKYPYPISEKITEYPPLVFILDTSSPEQISGAKIPKECKTIIIDHHRTGKLADIADMKIIDSTAHSTAVLVYDMLTSAGIQITAEIAFFLMAAIVADTGYFKLIDKRDINIIHKLIDLVDLNDVFAGLSTHIEYDEKVARLTGLQKMEAYTIKNKIIVFSEVNSFESKVAQHIMTSFADIAIVENIGKNSIRISARARKYLNDYIDLSLIFKGIGKDIKGNGGGHKTAASANGSDINNREVVKEKIKTYLESALNGRVKPLTQN